MGNEWDKEVIIIPPDPRTDPHYWDEVPVKKHYPDFDDSVTKLVRIPNERFTSQKAADAWFRQEYPGREIVEFLHTARYWCWRVR